MANSGNQTKCGQCKNIVFDSQKAVQCDGHCNLWFHIWCVNLSDEKYKELSRDKYKEWYCPCCENIFANGSNRNGDDVATVDRILKKLSTLKPVSKIQSESSDDQEQESSTGVAVEFRKRLHTRGQVIVRMRKRRERQKRKITNLEASQEEENLNTSQKEENPKTLKLENKQLRVNKVLWRCPLCCQRRFEDHFSLMRHLEVMLSEVYCPGCWLYVGGVQSLLDHLQKGCPGVTNFSRCSAGPSPSAKEQASSLEAVLIDLEEDELSETETSGGEGHRDEDRDPSPLVSGTAACPEPGPDLCEGSKEQSAVGEKQVKAQSLFNCSVCCVTFSSVEEHVSRYHAEQDVIVKRLGATEVCNGKQASSDAAGFDGSVSEDACPKPVAQQSSAESNHDEDCDPLKLVKKKVKKNVKLKQNHFNKNYFPSNTKEVIQKCQQRYSKLNDLNDKSGEKRRKVLKVALTRITDKELNKHVPSLEEKRQKIGERDVSRIYASVKDGDILGTNAHDNQIGSVQPANDKEVGISVPCSKQVPIPKSTPAVFQPHAEVVKPGVTRGSISRSLAARDVMGNVGTPISSVRVNSSQSSTVFRNSLVSVESSPAESTGFKSVPSVPQQSSCTGPPAVRPLPGMSCDSRQVPNTNSSSVVGGEANWVVGNFVPKRDLMICDCVTNQAVDLNITKIFDETGRYVHDLYVCVKCKLGFVEYMLYSKHICEKSNFVCSCSKLVHNVPKRRKVSNHVVISERTVRDPYKTASGGGKDFLTNVGSWRRKLPVTTSKTLVCSVCSNMFLSDGSSSPVRRTTNASAHNNVLNNAGGTNLNYICKICSIVTEKRQGRILVSKVSGKTEEAIEIVVIDPNADCDAGT